MTQLALIVYKALNAFNLECSLSSERVFAVIICMFFLCFYSLSSGCLPFSLIYIFTIEGKGSPYSITERRVPELIPVLCSQPAGDTCHPPSVGCHYFSPGLQLPSQPLRGLRRISLLA